MDSATIIESSLQDLKTDVRELRQDMKDSNQTINDTLIKLAHVLDKQDEVLEKIAKQGESISLLSSAIQEQDHRLSKLEEGADLRKENVKGQWAFWTAIAAALISLAGVLVSFLR